MNIANRTTHDVLQGTGPWLRLREGFNTASEAPAALGVGKYTTRAELLRRKHTGFAPEPDAATLGKFAAGHAAEAGARPLAEEALSAELFPITMSAEADGMRLLASLDGITLDGETIWETKLWNEELAAAVRAGELPPHYTVQMDQELLVSGARRCLFTCTDGTQERFEACWYDADETKFAALLDGWRQFERDLAAYKLPDAADPAPTGKPPETMPALRIEVVGQVTASNLAEFKATAMAAIRSVNRDLKTDADFADAKRVVKWCEEVESKLKAAKEHALSQTASIDALFKTIDDIISEYSGTRIDVDKLVKRRDREVREHAVLAARSALDLHITVINAELAPMHIQQVAADFAGAIKGLRSISSMQDALDTALANAKIAADAQARTVRANVATFHERAAGVEFLFVDLHTLVCKAPDDFGAVVDARIAKHKADKAAREERRKAEEAARIAAAEQRALGEAPGGLASMPEAAGDLSGWRDGYVSGMRALATAMQGELMDGAIYGAVPVEAAPQERKAMVLKGVGKINGDGWKDTTKIDEVVHVWNRELPEPYAPGQYPRIGFPVWSASTSQYDFRPIDDATAMEVIDRQIEVLRTKVAGTFDLVAHLRRQADFSARTFGPGQRTKGVCDHIRKELVEVEDDAAAGKPTLGEWIDVMILAFDGAWRSGATPEQIVDALVSKQAKNERRRWPDWRTADPNKAIEHDRSGDAFDMLPDDTHEITALREALAEVAPMPVNVMTDEEQKTCWSARASHGLKLQVAAVNAAPALLAEVDRLRAELQRAGSARPWERCREHGEAEPNVWACPACLVELRADVERLRAELQASDVAAERARWTSALGAVMPDDFKCWHQNSADELPEVAAGVIRNLRERLDAAEELAVIGPPDDVLAMLKKQGARTSATGAPNGWLTIETAPKDGTSVLAYRATTPPHIEAMYWEATNDDGDGAWHWTYDGDSPSGSPPDFWMPLPAAPGAPQTAQAEPAAIAQLPTEPAAIEAVHWPQVVAYPGGAPDGIGSWVDVSVGEGPDDVRRYVLGDREPCQHRPQERCSECPGGKEGA